MILAGLGALGLLMGVFAELTLGAGFFNYAAVPIAAIVGAVVGASLGAAFRDWRSIVELAVAGAVGFGVGYWLIEFMRASTPILRQLGEGGSIVITGIIGGATLGAALGYLENRRLATEQRPRVRSPKEAQDCSALLARQLRVANFCSALPFEYQRG